MLISISALAAAQVAAPEAQAAPAPAAEAQVAPAVASQPMDAVAPSAPQSTVAIAQHGIVLWRNIEDGMTVAKLRALYPLTGNVSYKNDRTVLSDVPILEGCSAKVNVMHPNGVVKEIVMRGEGSIAGRCSIKIVTALSGKYGEPMDKDKVGGSFFAREGKNYIWSHDGVTMQMKRYTNGALGGGGLFAASWEMRYSANDLKIDM